MILSILSLVACQEQSELKAGCCLYDIIGEVLGRALSLHTSPLEHSKVLKIPTFRVNAFFCSNVNTLKGYHNKPLSVISNSAWIGLLDFFPLTIDGQEESENSTEKLSLKWVGYCCCLCLCERKIWRHFPPSLFSLTKRPQLLWSHLENWVKRIFFTCLQGQL